MKQPEAAPKAGRYTDSCGRPFEYRVGGQFGAGLYRADVGPDAERLQDAEAFAISLKRNIFKKA